MSTSNLTKPISWLSFLLALALLAGGIYWVQSNGRKAEVNDAAVATGGPGHLDKTYAKGAMAALLIHPQRKDIAAFSFANAKGEILSLSRWKGRVVLLNLWASWCAPCRKEMPELAQLQSELGGPDFEVIALNLDRKGPEAAAAFLKDIGADSLTLYVEPEAKSLAALKALGLPATILIDRAGKEAARLLGPAHWASAEAKLVITALLAEK